MAAKQTRDKRGPRRISWQAWRHRDSRHVQLTYDNVSASVTRDFKIHAWQVRENVSCRGYLMPVRGGKTDHEVARSTRKLNDNVATSRGAECKFNEGKLSRRRYYLVVSVSREKLRVTRNFVVQREIFRDFVAVLLDLNIFLSTPDFVTISRDFPSACISRNNQNTNCTTLNEY